MKLGTKMLVYFFLIGLILIACTPRATPVPVAPQEKASAPKAPAPAREAWQVEWERLVAEAKKEGQVNVISGVPDPLNKIKGSFKEKFGIIVEDTTLRAAEIVERLKRERMAGLYNWDIITVGTTQMTAVLQPAGIIDPIEPNLILPEVRDRSVYWAGELPLAAYGHAISICKGVQPSITINTDLVKVDEIKSYKDLLSPKWKGKILMDDPTTAGMAYTWANYIYQQNVAGGEDFLRALVKQEPAINRDRRLLSEWVARGKYEIALCARPEITVTFIKEGAPLKFIIPVEPLHLEHAGSAAALINKASHPSAARVLLNWVMTKEGGEIWAPGYLLQSSRNDVSMGFLPPDLLRKPGVKYFDANNEEFEMKMPKAGEAIAAIFAPLLK